jgi:hypothetical protein
MEEKKEVLLLGSWGLCETEIGECLSDNQGFIVTVEEWNEIKRRVSHFYEVVDPDAIKRHNKAHLETLLPPGYIEDMEREQQRIANKKKQGY